MTGDGMVRHVGEPPANARLDEPRVEDGYLLLVGASVLQESSWR